MAVEPAPAPESKSSTSDNKITPEEEQAIGEVVVTNMVVSNMDLPQRMKGMKIDHDLWRPQSGQPGAKDHMPITPIKL
jgi:hypothetical protein